MLNKDRLKDTTLDNSADIYKPREEKSEKQKLSEMTFQDKVSYLKSYYLAKTVAIIAIIAFAGYLFYTILTPKPETLLYAAIVNYAIPEETAATLQSDFSNHLGITSDKEEVMFDTSFYLGSGNDTSEYTMSAQEKLSVYFTAGDVDVLIAPESIIKNYASFGYLDKLTDQLPTDLCTSLSESFLFSTTEDNPVSGAYGIYLDGTALYNGTSDPTDRPVLAIVINSDQKQNAIEFIRYLFKLD